MFDFFMDAFNYDQRVVDRYEEGEVVVDTASVSDGSQPYETGICHPEYNDGDWVIVEAYDTKEEAQEGHIKWVYKMTDKNLPTRLTDCCNAGIAQLFGDDLVFPRIISVSAKEE